MRDEALRQAIDEARKRQAAVDGLDERLSGDSDAAAGG